MRYGYRPGELWPRRCSDCTVPKARDDFKMIRPRSRPEHVNSICRVCHSRRSAEWRRKTDAERGRSSRLGAQEAATNRRREKIANDESRRRAGNAGKEWTSAELIVADNRARTAREVGDALGRSIRAVRMIRHKIDAEDPRTLHLLGGDP